MNEVFTEADSCSKDVTSGYMTSLPEETRSNSMITHNCVRNLEANGQYLTGRRAVIESLLVEKDHFRFYYVISCMQMRPLRGISSFVPEFPSNDPLLGRL